MGWEHANNQCGITREIDANGQTTRVPALWWHLLDPQSGGPTGDTHALNPSVYTDLRLTPDRAAWDVVIASDPAVSSWWNQIGVSVPVPAPWTPNQVRDAIFDSRSDAPPW